jgi:ketose-bisphosphate aldolase
MRLIRPPRTVVDIDRTIGHHFDDNDDDLFENLRFSQEGEVFVTVAEAISKARSVGTVVPAFNIPYLPMMAPIVRALRDANSFGLIMVARLEWVKFEARSLDAVAEEYRRVGDPDHTRLHLDHVPVIDEDNQRVDFVGDISRALAAGYESVMVDGSRLSLAENIAATKQIVDLAHAHGVAVEGELGAVMGHESGPLPPYEELFASGKGFTDPQEAIRFVRETGVDWLSVAAGSVHGAISAATRNQKKVEARLNIEHLEKLHQVTGVPLVLHGGTGIRKEYVMQAIRHGIAKINIGTATRQRYEQFIKESVVKAQQAVYDAAVEVICEDLEVEGLALLLK